MSENVGVLTKLCSVVFFSGRKSCVDILGDTPCGHTQLALSSALRVLWKVQVALSVAKRALI
jgi:hypothetical protein